MGHRTDAPVELRLLYGELIWTAVKFDVTRNGRTEQRDDIVQTRSTLDEIGVGTLILHEA